MRRFGKQSNNFHPSFLRIEWRPAKAISTSFLLFTGYLGSNMLHIEKESFWVIDLNQNNQSKSLYFFENNMFLVIKSFIKGWYSQSSNLILLQTELFLMAPENTNMVNTCWIQLVKWVFQKLSNLVNSCTALYTFFQWSKSIFTY